MCVGFIVLEVYAKVMIVYLNMLAQANVNGPNLSQAML